MTSFANKNLYTIVRLEGLDIIIMDGLVFICWLIFSGLVYIPIGALLIIRSHKKSIRNRSPLLVSIAHWSNFLESALLLLSLYFYFSHSTQDRKFDTFYQIIVIIVHYSYFIAYMLRCYRVYFIFNLENQADEEDSFFNKNIHRAGQKWLIKVFLMLLWPVFLIAILRILISGADEYFPPSYYEDQSHVTVVSEGIYLFILFLEELGFIFAVFKLRNVNDDFKMTVEVTSVCVLWVLTGMFSIFPQNWVWRVEVVIRNHLIMGISSIYPLVKSLAPESFDEVITLEMLQSLEVVLQSEITLDAFEKAVKNSNVKSYNGFEILQLWLKCENYKFKETQELKQEILGHAKHVRIHSKDPDKIQIDAFNILNQYFFPVFRHSEEYRVILHDVAKQQIYVTRIMQTSLGGSQNEVIVPPVH